MLKTAYQIIEESVDGEAYLAQLQKYEVNQLRLIKAEAAEGGGEPITGFLGGSLFNDDPCQAEFTETFDIQLYHNGEGEFPEVGDTIYVDAQGTSPRTINFAYFNGLVNVGVQVNLEGVSESFTCR